MNHIAIAQEIQDCFKRLPCIQFSFGDESHNLTV